MKCACTRSATASARTGIILFLRLEIEMMVTIPPTRQAIIDDIHMKLSIFSVCTMLQNGVGFFNLNHHAEDLFCKILNEFKANDGWNLTNVNPKTLNHPGFDLVDDDKHVVVQVTSERTLSKLKDALTKTSPNYKGYSFYFLSFNIVPPPVKSWSEDAIKGLEFPCDFKIENIISLDTISKWTLSIDEDTLKRVWHILATYVNGEQPDIRSDGISVTKWISCSGAAYRRLQDFSRCEDIHQINRMLDPVCHVNWSIIEMSADILTLKGEYLHDEVLVKLLDSLNQVCDVFAMSSGVRSKADLVALRDNADKGTRFILDVLEHLANKASIKEATAKQMFMDFVNS